jgi:outer membrane lipoprotein SlyB
MKSFNNFSSALGVVAVLTLGACAELTTPTNTYGSGTTYPQAVGTTNVYSGYGVVQAIELVQQEAAGVAGTGVGAGTIAGAVVGGIVGSQVGEGQGKTAATVLGAAGGAYVGHEMEKRSQQQTQAYRFTIRMSNGAVQTMTQTTLADIRVGDRVMIENGVARRY